MDDVKKPLKNKGNETGASVESPQAPAPATAPKKERATPTELQAMGRIERLLMEFDEPARSRIVRWVADKTACEYAAAMEFGYEPVPRV